MMETEKVYVEDQTIVLPNIVDGPTAIGDLWNCQESKLVGLNLFGKVLDSQYLDVHETKELKYTLTHVRSIMDRLKLLKLSGEVTLELLAGFIKYGGGGEDEINEKPHTSEEILCHYDLKTFSVKAHPSAREVMDPQVTEKILKGEIKATHVVMTTILGAEVMASIRLRETISKSTKDIMGNMCEKFVGPISSASKVALEKLDASKFEDVEKKIKVDSKPFLNSQPVTVSGMFQFIESIGKRVEEEKHPAFVNTKDYAGSEVYGVPLRFYLVPIKLFFDFPVERLYMQMKDDVLENITNILATLIDFQTQGYFKKQIFKREPRLKSILLDDKDLLVGKISQREEEIQALAKQQYISFVDTLNGYKMGNFDQQHLLRLANEIDKVINITSVLQEMQRFTSEGQMQLLGIHDGDIDDTHQLKIFTNNSDMMAWYQAMKTIKVLFRTGGNCLKTGQVKLLFDISSGLKAIGVEVSVAVPVISEGRHDIAIKIDDSEKVYAAEEVSFVIKILLLLVNQADQTTTRLFTIYASLNGIKLPLQRNLTDLHSTIAILSDVKHIKVADSYLKLRDLVLQRDGRWKFVMDLNALDSTADAIDKFRYLNVQLSDIVGEWIVGNYGFESPIGNANAPLLFIFKDEKLQAVCFDNVDILLLLEAFKPKGDFFWKLLQPDRATMEKSCLHKTRKDFALKVVQLFQNNKRVLENEPTLPENGTFSSTINKKVEATQILVRSFVGNNEISLWRAMANIVLHDFPDASAIFKSHTWIEDRSAYPAGFRSESPQHLAAALKEFLSLQDPFYAKAQVVLGSTSSLKTSVNQGLEAVEECINTLIRDIECPTQLKEQLICCQELEDNSDRLEKIEKILKKHLEAVIGNKCETIALFINLLELPPENLEDYLAGELLQKLVAWLNVDDSKYPMFHSKLLNLVDSHSYYVLLLVLAQMQYVEDHILLVCNQLDALTSITDIDPLCQLLGKASLDKLSVDHYQWLFTNPKFIFLIKTNSSCSQLLQTIKFFHCQKAKIPDYIPDFLKVILQAMMDDNLIELPDLIHNVDQAVAVFQRIVSLNCVPDNFGKVLGDSVRKSLELQTALKAAKALSYWSEERQLFTESWNCETIKDAYEQLIEWKHSLDHQEPNDERSVIALNIDICQRKLVDSHSDEENLDQQCEAAGFSRTRSWTTLLGSFSQTISLKNFLEIQSILAEPHMRSLFEEGFIAKLLPYIVQRLKMWGIHVIQQENLAKLNSQASIPKSRCFKKFVFDADTSQCEIPLGYKTELNSNCQIARIDILTCLNAVCHTIVYQDLLRVISQFPVALPLVLQDLHTEKWDYVYLVSLLKNISVKWEIRPGVVIHNQLFINPFRMVVAFRVGSAKSGSSGKSTVLNQILGTKHMFSSLGGPGADRGVPITLCGSVELVVLLQETCSYALWESVVKNHYSSRCNEVVMLANVHGDILELPQTIDLMKRMATSFIAFFMPCTRSELQTRSMMIQEMLDGAEDIVYILVDPTPECEGQPTNTISTNQLTLDYTLETVRSALDAAIQMGVPKTLTHLTNLTNSIRPSQNIATEESELLITHVKELGCKKARLILQLQKVNPKYTNNYPALVRLVWEKNANIRSLITKFAQVLNLPLKFRLLAFAHLDRELSLLTANESRQIREKLGKFQEQRRRLLNLEGGYALSTEQKKIIGQIRLTMDELDGMSLGMEHLYRELGRIYQAVQSKEDCNNEQILSLPKRYAELLIWGHAVEILDGDIGDMCGPWLDAICHSVCESYPELRIFTLSIIGLQSSGKSTLLNALFACKFAVSVGRCTRGLFMRLIFLDKSLTDKLKIDAILLIDTEGLGAPEKLNDPEAEHKDRLLATFAMSVSNLTLINVLGESVRDLTDILQIVIVTMARLEKADISPDILMVQHLSERDSSKTMKGADEFCKALEEAVSLIDKKDMAIGVRNCNSLRKLEHRVKNGELLKQFRSFKNGASANAPPSQEYHEDVVDLYKTILNSCKQVAYPQKFHNWHELMQNYWSAVSTQDFSLRFKNIQEVHEFIDRGSTIAKIKGAVDAAFRIHRESCETKLRQKIKELANNPVGIQNWEEEKADELERMREVLKWIPNSCDPPCSKCSEAVHLKNQLFRDLEGKNCQHETEITIHMYIQRTRESVIKHLNQMAEAIRVKHGWSCEFDAIIGSILMDKLEDETNPSETERNEMVNEVWSQLSVQISEQLQVVSAKRRIYDEVKVEYFHATTVIKHLRKEKANQELPKLRDVKAIDFSMATTFVNRLTALVSFPRHRSSLDFKQVTFLESKLDNLPNYVLKKCGTEHFEDGMVRMLKEEIDKVLHELETMHIPDGKLVPKFKWKVHVYALLKFVEEMTLKEEEWNRNNNPYYILLQNEDTYRKTIYIRLKHGFGFEAEGRIVGDLLLKAIRKRGQKQGDRAYIDHIRSASWLTSSENVRLSYFSKLARKVEEGDTEQALEHFRNPKATIEVWFKNKVDSFCPEVGERKFIETMDSEFDYVVQEIRNKKSCREIKAFIGSYLTQVEDMAYNPGVDLDSDSPSDFDFLQTVILKRLDEDKLSVKFDVTLIKPSTNLEVNSLLGCTEHCFWCGSLCWGQVGHGENTDSTNKHHACHQPMGLIGVHHKHEMYLLSNSCDIVGDNWTVYWHKCNEGMSWLNAKSHEDFVNWTFTPHHKSEFNELMKWFFLNLYENIANSRGLLPARSNDLTAGGFFNLVSLDHILVTIKSRI